VRRNFAVTYTSTRTCREPTCGGPEQRRRSCRKGQNDSTPAGAADVFLRAGGHLVDAPFRIGLGKTGIGGCWAHEVGTILRLHAAMTRGGQQDAGRLYARIIEIGILSVLVEDTAEDCALDDTGLPSRTAASSSAVRTRTPTGLPHVRQETLLEAIAESRTAVVSEQVLLRPRATAPPSQ